MRGLAMKAFGLLMAGVLLASFSLGTGAQDKKEATQAAPSTATPAASPKDVQSLDAMVAAIYDVISGPPGARDWNRFRSLFATDARLIAVRVPKEGKPTMAVMTPKDYEDRAGKYFLEHGFFEHVGHGCHHQAHQPSLRTPEERPLRNVAHNVISQ